MRGLKLSVPTLSPPSLGVEEMEVESIVMANDLIIYGYVKKAAHTTSEGQRLRASGLLYTGMCE